MLSSGCLVTVCEGATCGDTKAAAPEAGAGACSPANCSDGCCDGATCIRTDSQTSSQCGVYAEACQACTSNNRCERGSCRGPDTCTTGCHNTDICHTGKLSSRCGPVGSACTLCESACVKQQCAPAAVLVGDPCTSDSSCAGLGRGAYCRLHTTGGVAYPGGFCTLPCEGTSASCTGISDCVSFPTRFGESVRLCAPTCHPRGCRAGYSCYDGLSWNGASLCWIDPPPATSLTAAIGSPCLDASDCGPGRVCQRPYDGAHTGYYGGYCTSSCTPGAPCGNGSDVCVTEGGVSLCRAPCSVPGRQAECRTEYVCEAGAAGNWCASSCTWGRTCPQGKTCNRTTGDCR